MPLYAPAVVPPNPAAGMYVFTAAAGAVSTTAALGTGSLRVAPWIVYRTLAIDRIGAEVTSAGDAGSKFRIGIYADTGAGVPGALVLDAGQIAGDSATVQELTVSATLTPGMYWIGGAVQSVSVTQPTMRICAAAAALPGFLPAGQSTLPTAGQLSLGVTVASVTAGLPTPFGTAAVNGTGTARVFVRTV